MAVYFFRFYQPDGVLLAGRNFFSAVCASREIRKEHNDWYVVEYREDLIANV